MEEDYDGLLEMLLDRTSPIDAPPSPSPIDLPPAISSSPSSELDFFADPSGGDMQDQRSYPPNPCNSAGNFMANNITFVSTVPRDSIAFMPTPPSLSSPPSQANNSSAPNDNGQIMFSMGPFPMRTRVPLMPATTIAHSAVSLGTQTFSTDPPTSPYQLPGNNASNYQYNPIIPSYQNPGLSNMRGLLDQKYHYPNMASSSSLPFFSSPFARSLNMQSHSPIRGLAWSNPKLNPTQNGVGTTSSYLAAKANPKNGRPHTFKCSSCSVEFPNAQAYGGHMSSHSKSAKSGTSFALSVIQNINFKRTLTSHGSGSKGTKPMASSTKESSISDGVGSYKKKDEEVLQAANSSNKEKSTTERKEEEEEGSSISFPIEEENRENTNEGGTKENGSTDNPPVEEQQIYNATEGGTEENGSNDNHPIEEKQIEKFGNIGDAEDISGIFNFADESPLDLWNWF